MKAYTLIVSMQMINGIKTQQRTISTVFPIRFDHLMQTRKSMEAKSAPQMVFVYKRQNL